MYDLLSHTPSKLTSGKSEMLKKYVYVVSRSHTLSWSKSIDSLELEAICSTSSKPSGKSQASAMLLPKHSNYYKHGRHGADSYTQAENEC